MATIERPLPMSWAPQDVDCFVRARSKVNVRNLMTVQSSEQFHSFVQVSFLFTRGHFLATTFKRVTDKAVAQSAGNLGFKPCSIRWSKSVMSCKNDVKKTIVFVIKI